jgi:hypothetical protein
MRRLVVALTLLLAPASASAEERRWYGWQIAISDVVFDAAFVLLTGEDGGSDGAIGAAGALVGGPIIHLVHRHHGKAALSGGMRLAGAALSLALAVDCCEDDPDRGDLVKIIVPLLLAQAFDIAIVAHETVPGQTAWYVPAPALTRDGALLVWSISSP